MLENSEENVGFFYKPILNVLKNINFITDQILINNRRLKCRKDILTGN